MADDPATKPIEQAKLMEQKEGKGSDDSPTELSSPFKSMEEKGENRSGDSTAKLAGPSKIKKPLHIEPERRRSFLEINKLRNQELDLQRRRSSLESEEKGGKRSDDTTAKLISELRDQELDLHRQRILKESKRIKKVLLQTQRLILLDEISETPYELRSKAKRTGLDTVMRGDAGRELHVVEWMSTKDEAHLVLRDVHSLQDVISILAPLCPEGMHFSIDFRMIRLLPLTPMPMHMPVPMRSVITVSIKSLICDETLHNELLAVSIFFPNAKSLDMQIGSLTSPSDKAYSHEVYSSSSLRELKLRCHGTTDSLLMDISTSCPNIVSLVLSGFGRCLLNKSGKDITSFKMPHLTNIHLEPFGTTDCCRFEPLLNVLHVVHVTSPRLKFVEAKMVQLGGAKLSSVKWSQTSSGCELQLEGSSAAVPMADLMHLVSNELEGVTVLTFDRCKVDFPQSTSHPPQSTGEESSPRELKFLNVECPLSQTDIHKLSEMYPNVKVTVEYESQASHEDSEQGTGIHFKPERKTFPSSSPSPTSSVDDTDNNEGNDGQLISFKHDSGKDREDISFGGLSAPPEILARGPRAQQAYVEAAKAGTKKVFRTRLMLVGQERVGKTSLKKTLTGQGFDKNEAITDGVETTNVCEINIEVAKAGEKMWSIHKKGHGNEDKREDEYSKALADEIAKRLIVTPPQDQESSGLSPEKAEDENKKSLADERAKRLIVAPPQVIIISIQDQDSLEPHSDTTPGKYLDPVEADESVLDNVAKEEDDNIPYQISSLVEKRLKKKETDRTDSGKVEGVLLSIWDFAGQDIYYTTHQVFLTWRAIYVIVFDLRSLCPDVPPDEMAKGGAKSELTCLEFINFWLCSIFAHAVAPSSVKNKNTSKTAEISPPIFIVGTHRGSVKGDGKIDSAFEKIRKSIMKKPFECHVIPKYYAIENSLEDKDEQLIALTSDIEKEAMNEPYMGEEIPLRWLYFEENLAAEENYMSLDQTKELMLQVGITSERELLTMLTFYHDLGYIVYYGGIEEQKSLLRDMVILNPQWLVDVFKQVITIMDHADRDRIVINAWSTLETDGILEDRLIQHVWQGFSDQKDTLVQLMAKFDLICEVPVKRIQQEQQYGEDTEVSNEPEKVVKKRYYVPCRMTTHCPPEEKAQIKSSTVFYVDFKGFLPDGLFHRLMARAVRWMGERVDLFYRHISLMVDDEHHVRLEMLPPNEAIIKVTVFQGAVANFDHDGDGHKPPVPSAVKKVMDFVERNLDDLIKRWARKIEYDVCFLCPTCSKKTLLKHSFKWKSLKCGEHTIRTAAVKSRFGMSEEGVETGNKSPVMPKRSKQLQDASSSQTAQTSHPSTGETLDTPQLMMKEILTDIFLLRLSKKINLVNVPAVDFSLYLGFSTADGTAAAMAASVALNPQSAFNTLLSKFVMTNGRKSKSALNLRKRFLDSEMKDCADVIKAELERFGISVPSGEEILMGTPAFTPSSTGGTPDQMQGASS